MSARSLGAACLVVLVSAALLAAPAGAAPAAPVPVAPAASSTIVVPTFAWKAVAGAAKYQLQVGPQSDTTLVYWTGTTKNLGMTSTDSRHLPNEALYWRVRAIAPDASAGAWSARVPFTKHIVAPTLTSPGDLATIAEPVLTWSAANGATWYRVEVSDQPSFVPLTAYYLTYDLSIDPVNTIGIGRYYWRVAGMDADSNLGEWSAPRSFTLGIAPPTLLSPADDATVAAPEFAWQGTQGAVRYEIQISTVVSFVPVYRTYTTYQSDLTPTATLPLDDYFWRVRGLDADGHPGTWSEAFDFTLHAAAAAVDVVPQLTGPADGSTLTRDAWFGWTRSVGAASYRLIVDDHATFASPYVESLITHYPSYAPSPLGSRTAYANGTYYWRVEARNSSGAVIGTSDAHTFTIARPVTLTGPAGGAALQGNPIFRWNNVPGARTYRIHVDTEAGFHTPYADVVVTDYRAYVPYTPGDRYAYANGTYYWRVQALSSSNVVLATSNARSFTVVRPIHLNAPANGVTLAGDPTFRWARVVGARTYHLVVDTTPDFTSPLYDLVATDYWTYTPCVVTGGRSVYANDTYYWRIEARSSADQLLSRSPTRHFTVNR